MTQAIAAAIAVAAGALVGFGMTLATGKAAESIARQPESTSNIRSTLLIGLVLSESTAIYGFVIAILLIIMK